MNFYPFHIGDYRSATMHLTNEEDLAYRRLLDFYYDTEQLIPLDTQWVSRRLRIATQHIDSVLNDFFERTPEGFKNRRCDAVIAEYNARGARSRENGAKGGRRKSAPEKEKEPTGTQQVPRANPEPAQPLANHKPITINHKPIEREGETSEKARKRATHLPENWVIPEEWLTWATEKRPDLNAYETAQKFADYWHAKPSDATRLDWFATWRNWVRGEKREHGNSRESFAERDERRARERMAEWTGNRSNQHIDAIDVTPDIRFLEQNT